MITAPPNPQRGEEFFEWAVRVAEYLRWLTPRDSPEVGVQMGPGGTRLHVRKGRGGGGASPAEGWAFQVYAVTNLGDGADEEEKILVGVTLGTVNDQIPGNNNAQFECEPSDRTFVWVKASFAADGSLTGVILDVGDELPEDPTPEVDAAPAYSCRALSYVDCDGTKVTKIGSLWKGPLEVHPVVIRYDCGTNTLAIQWSSGGQIQ